MIKNFSMGKTAKGAVWYSYTTAEGAKVASGGTGPAHADSFAGALAASGIAAGGVDLAPVVAAQRERLAIAAAQCESHAATIADLRAQLANLQSAAVAVVSDLPMRDDPAGDRAVTLLRATKAQADSVATVTPIRKAKVAPAPVATADDPVGAHLAELGVANG